METAKSAADDKKAVTEFDRACALAPEWPDPYYNLVIVQEASGEHEAAAKSLQRCLELSPGAGDAAEVKKKVYKLECLADRNNIDGGWKVDTGKYSTECDPKNCVLSYGRIVSPVSVINAQGGVNSIPDYKTGKVQWVWLNGSGKIVFQRVK